MTWYDDIQDYACTQVRVFTPRFFVRAMCVYVCMALVLLAFDFMPESTATVASSEPESRSIAHVALVVDGTEEGSSVVHVATSSQHATVARARVVPTNMPVHLTVPSVGINTVVLNPEDTSNAVLDRSLLSGAVRYPGSGLPGQVGNMLIFGHSSYLPVVKNKAFQAFNELGTLRVGDTVTVQTGTEVYTYDVVEVRLTRAEDAVVSFAAEQPTLTLATCNTFGTKQERWVVRAVQTTVRSL